MIKDSGHRKQFESGAVRDARPGVGRCDLLPLGIIGSALNDPVLINIELYIRKGSLAYLWNALTEFVTQTYKNMYTAFLEASIQYEEGAKKYDERNWEKGIPLHCYIDSGVRHYLKWRRGDTDKSHARAFIWNMLGAIYTHTNLPDLIDLPFKNKEETK